MPSQREHHRPPTAILHLSLLVRENIGWTTFLAICYPLPVMIDLPLPEPTQSERLQPDTSCPPGSQLLLEVSKFLAGPPVYAKTHSEYHQCINLSTLLKLRKLCTEINPPVTYWQLLPLRCRRGSFCVSLETTFSSIGTKPRHRYA